MLFTHDLSCPLCDGAVRLVAKSAPNPYHSAFVIACDKCKREMVVKIDLSLSYKPDTKECGSMAGYNRHLRRNETPCQECSDARNFYERERRQAIRERQRESVSA